MEEAPTEARAADQRLWLPTQAEPQAASTPCHQPQLLEMSSPELPQPMRQPQQPPPTTPLTPLLQAAASAMALPVARPLPPWHLRPNVPATAPQPPTPAAPTLVSWMHVVARATISASQLATALATRPHLSPDELARLAEANATDARQVFAQTDSAANWTSYATAPKPAPLPPPPSPFPPPPLAPPPQPSAVETDTTDCRRLQRAAVQAMRYRRKRATLHDGISFDGLRALLPKRTGTRPPTDADLLQAVQISGGRLWTTAQGAEMLIYCAPKDQDQQHEQEPSPPDDANYFESSMAGSSLLYPSSSVPRPPVPRGSAARMPHLTVAPTSTKCKPQQRPQHPQQREDKPAPSLTPSPSRSPPRRSRKGKSPREKSPQPQQYTLTAEQARVLRMWEHYRFEDQGKPKKMRRKNRTGHHSPTTYHIESTEEADLHGDDVAKAKTTKRRSKGDA